VTTLRDLIDETKRHLQSFQREPMNKLVSAVPVDATSITLQYDIGNIQAGAHVQLGLELVYVWSTEPSSKTITVERAQLGSTASAHAAGSTVTINPKFPDFAIAKAINDDLADLSAPANGLFAVRALDLTFGVGASGYDLAGATGFIEVLEIRQRLGQATAYRQWPVLSNYEVSRQVSTVDFPSGIALFLHEGGGAGQPVRVLYKASFGRLTNLTDDVETVAGITTDLEDLPPIGAALRMVAPREIKRNFTEAQGESRRAQEVPPGAVANSLRPLAGLRQNRITAEAGRLAQLYPDRGFIPSSNSAYNGWRGGFLRSGRRW
jgi:hypothetical protein